ncbi:MAG: hypothetical protein LJE69_09405 [Thiohalocapsa sp.]|jgi:hypothetical protein|uniref:hypothetical protein n=1 Tax=Thiohalocapsa sp. TaxID=2497641 RepID=UPI0025F92432|nr:hypothetical protein [Thiohalocapsa sp.]MCG6941454.1 hypothetical protein [Thiohalocapsa sp.]
MTRLKAAPVAATTNGHNPLAFIIIRLFFIQKRRSLPAATAVSGKQSFQIE